jgi:hypothetical protein
MGMSPATVKRDWITARAWLLQQLTFAAEMKASGVGHAQ